ERSKRDAGVECVVQARRSELADRKDILRAATNETAADVPAVGLAEQQALRVLLRAFEQCGLQRVDQQAARDVGQLQLVGDVAFARAVPVQMFLVQAGDHAKFQGASLTSLEAGQFDHPQVGVLAEQFQQR